jgi:alcohol dehydrogenase/propanol-preferring alcohol dehydrogenase
MKMWALVEARKPLQAIEVATPQPKGTEVVVEISHCGVCHTDLHFWEGEFNLGHGKKVTLLERGTKLPMALGHEIVGHVAAVGPEAQDVEVGDHRIVYPWIGCGKCPACKSGNENMCADQMSLGLSTHGGFATHVLVPHPRYLIDLGNLDPALASTFACSGITVLGAIKKLGKVDPESPVLIVGAGGLGLAAIATLIAMDHRNIIVAEIDETKRQSALASGATAVVDANAEDVAAKIKQIAGGPILYSIDFVNNTKTAAFTNAALGKGGVQVLVGVAGGEMDLSLNEMIFGARTIVGTNAGNIDDLKEVVALAQSGKLKPIPINRMRIEKVNDAMQRLYAGAITGRIVLENLPER